MIHTAVAVLAMIVGGVVVLRPKGTSRHKLWGRAYVASMVGLNVTALSIYRLYGTFGPFHWIAVFSLASVLLAFAFAASRRPRGWMILHGETMSWSYVGLLAAAVSELSVRVLHYPFGWTVALSTLFVAVIGGTVTWRTMRRFEARGLRSR